MSCKIRPLVSCYSDKVNIYQHPDFISLAAIKQYPPPPPLQFIHATTNYGQPFPVPTHQPPFPSCQLGRDCCQK